MTVDNEAFSSEALEKNLRTVEEQIQAACDRVSRDRSSVSLISVTKRRVLPALAHLHRLGERHFGENRVQDARDRIPQCPDGIQWHFIGPLQSNKAKYLPGLFQWVHSVEKLSLAKALDKAWGNHPDLEPLNILLQFNIAGEEQKHGAEEDEALQLLNSAFELPHIKVRGLMCMAPYSDDPETSRPVFAELRRLRDHLQEKSGYQLPELSMGMSNDFEIAIEEGATMVRVGSSLFDGV